MTLNNDTQPAQKLPVISPQEEAELSQTVYEIFDLDTEKRLPIVEDKLKSANAQAVGDASPRLKSALQALWWFCNAEIYVRKQADWVKAHELLSYAADGFNSIGRNDLRDLSFGLGTYTEAIIEIQHSNIGQALVLFANVKKYLDQAGEFGSEYRQLIDQMEPDALYIAGIKAVMELDYNNAQMLIERASQSAEDVASNYYPDGSSTYYSFMGLARIYKANYTYFQASADFNRFQLDGLLNKKNLIEDAQQAQDLLSKGDLQYKNIRDLAQIASALVDLLTATSDLARIMNNIFHSTFKPAPAALKDIQNRIASANEAIAKVGPQMLPFARSISQLSERVNNLERLAKPSNKDFGALSGLVSSALFLPLFLVVSWSNAAFKIGLNATTAITTCLILALIAGFGFGALRFKGLIFPTKA